MYVLGPGLGFESRAFARPGIEPFLKFRARAKKKSQILMPSPKSRAIQLQLSSFLSRYVSEWAYFKVEGEIRVIDLVQGSGMI